MKDHANTATAVGVTGLAALIVWLLGFWDIVDVPPAVSATIAGLLVGLALGIKNRGIKGLAAMVWGGNHAEPEPPPPPPPPARRQAPSRRKR